MKIVITTMGLLWFISSFQPAEVVAQETEENVRMEYIICNLKDGFTFQDVIENAKEYGEKVQADGSKYNQYLMRPLIAGERSQDFTHILAGVWPNGEELYKEYGNYVNKYIDEDNENDPATCRTTVATMDHIIVDDLIENERQDARFPVQLIDCKLNEGVSMDYAVEVHKEAAEMIAETGMGGYGLHLQVPYLGFEDIDFDFITTLWWQSFEHRGNMAQNFYKIGEKYEQKMNSVATCKNPRAYFAESIFRTWE